MAQNVEIKASLSESDFQRIQKQLNEEVGSATMLFQTDTFFDANQGRLKLREFADGNAELIAYQRSDHLGPKLSDYIRCPIEHPERLKDSLERSIGLRGVVKKQRQLFLIGQTRIHLDDVDHLGKFIELEVVLHENQTEAEGKTVADNLISRLCIPQSSLIESAYMDLLELKKTEINAQLTS